MASKRAHTIREHNDPTDAILPMVADPWMEQIVSGQKTYEFRRTRIRPSVKRIWFYLTSPHSCIKYICEIDPARTRNPGDEPLEEGPLGNKEFNERHQEWDGYDYAYKIKSVHELRSPITLKDMKEKYGFKGAPRSIVFVKEDMLEVVSLDRQIKHSSQLRGIIVESDLNLRQETLESASGQARNTSDDETTSTSISSSTKKTATTYDVEDAEPLRTP